MDMICRVLVQYMHIYTHILQSSCITPTRLIYRYPYTYTRQVGTAGTCHHIRSGLPDMSYTWAMIGLFLLSPSSPSLLHLSFTTFSFSMYTGRLWCQYPTLTPEPREQVPTYLCKRSSEAPCIIRVYSIETRLYIYTVPHLSTVQNFYKTLLTYLLTVVPDQLTCMLTYLSYLCNSAR